MGETQTNPSKISPPVITERDILFECPACGKNLVVDESAEGVIVDCPRCSIQVIVPPKARPEVKASTPSSPPSQTATAPKAAVATPDVQSRGATLGNQLREIQMQRTEIHNRVASRLNELNRDLVLLARLDATQQKLVAEWNQLVGIPKPPPTGATNRGDDDNPSRLVAGAG
jgi:DNA-directed RNA polymerase subunit RPC12/RpoP